MGLTLLRLLETPHLRSKKQYVRGATSAAAVLDLFKQIWLTTQPKVHCRRHEWEIKLLISLVLLTDSIFFFLRGQVVRKARMRETDWCQCLIFKPYRKWTFTLQAGLRIDLDACHSWRPRGELLTSDIQGRMRVFLLSGEQRESLRFIMPCIGWLKAPSAAFQTSVQPTEILTNWTVRQRWLVSLTLLIFLSAVYSAVGGTER